MIGCAGQGAGGGREREQGEGDLKEETAEATETTVEGGKQPEEEEIDIDLEDPEVNAAATKIQAGFKGKKARDEVKEMKKMKEQYVDERAVFLSKPASEEEQKAASKIQAGFKGMRTRKKMKKRKALGNDILDGLKCKCFVVVPKLLNNYEFNLSLLVNG